MAITAPVPRPPHRLSAVVRRPLSDVLTPFWVLPDPEPCLVKTIQSESSGIVSIDAVADNFLPAAAPPRPPFTRTATLFGALRTSVFEARMLLVDFCNCIPTYGH